MFLHGADYNYEQWLDRPEILEQDFEAMKAAGCNTMTVGIFSWSKYEPREGEFHFEWMQELLDRLHAHGLKAILATPSGSKPAWLSRAYPEVCRTDAQGRREPHGGRHNHCRTSPTYRKACVRINTGLARRFGNHPAVILWHVSNEYGSGRCYCPDCLQAFRTWLKNRYQTLDAVNRAWWTDFWSHHFDSWDEIEPTDPSINGLMLDWARFTSDQTIDFFLAESEPLRQLCPEVPITTNFHGPDVGLDYFEFAKHLDVASWDSYPRWHSDSNDRAVAARTAFYHDLIRSTKDRPFLLMESTPSQTNWQGISPLKRPGLHVLASMQAVAHGSDSVQYFQWRQGRGGEETFHGSVLTLTGSMTSRTFREVTEVGSALHSLAEWKGASSRPEVAVILDFVSSWALEVAQIPRNIDKGYWDEVLAHHSALARRGYPAAVIDSVQDLSPYRVVVAPMLYLLRPSVVQRLTDFVTRGGTLITGYLTGWVNDTGLAFEQGRLGPLAEVVGLSIEETDALPDFRPQSLSWKDQKGPARSYPVRHYADLIELKGAEAMAEFEADFYAGSPAVTRHRVGRGEAWYVGARTEPSFLEEFLSQRCHDAGVSTLAEGPIPPGVDVVCRENGEKKALFVLNFNETFVDWDGPSGPVRLEPYGWRLLTPP